MVNGPLITGSAMEKHGIPSVTVKRISVNNLRDLFFRQYNQDFTEKKYGEKKDMSCKDWKFIVQ